MTDQDRGYRALLARARSLGKGRLVLSVGVQGQEAAAPKSGADELTVAEVAAFHEFGLGRNPERSFIRAWFDERLAEHVALLRDAARELLAGRALGAGSVTTEEEVLSRLGARFVGEVQERIAAGIPPALRPATVARKGSSTPLIDTGQLRAAVTWKVGPR